MALYQALAVVATVLVAVVAADKDPCQGDNWKTKTLEQRASEPDWIAYVKVTSDEMVVEEANKTSTDYEVSVNVSCWLKNGPEPDDKDDSDSPQTGDAATGDGTDTDDDQADTDMDSDHNMTVPDAGNSIKIILEKVSCKSHTLVNGEDYILFMKKHGSMFKIINVNSQTGAIMNPKNEEFQAVHRGIDWGMVGDPSGECVDGVDIPCFVGEDDAEGVCDQGMTVMATVTTVTVAAILAICAY